MVHAVVPGLCLAGPERIAQAAADAVRKTNSAVKQFQRAKGLEVDGQVGPGTWAAVRGTT